MSFRGGAMFDWKIPEETMALADQIGDQITGLYCSLADRVHEAEAAGYEIVPDSLRMVDESDPVHNRWKMSLVVDMRKRDQG